jgi:Bacterial SH3 domain./Tetratricopeptide repeat.
VRAGVQRTGILLLAGALLLVLPARGARADLLDEAWKRGNDAYFRGDFAGAVVAYEQLDRQNVVSRDLYYNLGVAHFRQGSLGRAIWSFERALDVDPDDEDARFNLTQARKLAERRVLDKIESAEREALWIRVVTFLTASTETWIFVGVYLGCFVLLFLRRRAADDSRAALTAGAAILGTGALLAGVLLLGRMNLDRIPFGIVLPDTVAVKEGAETSYRTSFEVHAGLRVRLLDRDRDWVRVRLANGLEGWLRAEDAGRL